MIKYDVYNGRERETQLFNLAGNPDELLKEHHDPSIILLTGNTPGPDQVNLARDPRYEGKLREMEELLFEQQVKHNDPDRLWDQPR